MKVLTREEYAQLKMLMKIKAEIKTKAENVDLLYKQTVTDIIDKHIAELKGENKEKPFDRTDDCLSYEESFCEARDCGECCCREIKGE